MCLLGGAPEQNRALLVLWFGPRQPPERMVIFSWIVLGIAGFLLLASAVCWGLFVAADRYEFKQLGVKIFRISMVFVLFYINAMIYGHLFGVVSGTQKPVVEVISEES